MAHDDPAAVDWLAVTAERFERLDPEAADDLRNELRVEQVRTAGIEPVTPRIMAEARRRAGLLRLV